MTVGSLLILPLFQTGGNTAVQRWDGKGNKEICKGTIDMSYIQYNMVNLSFIDPEQGGFGVIFPEVMIFSKGLCPEENIITEGNITPNPRAEGL
jgi:hypothetical protein